MPQRAYNIWSPEEVDALKRGVEVHGVGFWEHIRNDPRFTVLRYGTGPGWLRAGQHSVLHVGAGPAAAQQGLGSFHPVKCFLKNSGARSMPTRTRPPPPRLLAGPARASSSRTNGGTSSSSTLLGERPLHAGEPSVCTVEG